MEYKLIICGGTFDRLHAGHKVFLRFAFEKGEKVIIGLTSDEYVSHYKKLASALSFEQRKKELKEFLEKEHVLEKAQIVAINSRFDQTQLKDVDRAALLVSSETYPVGLEINREREKNGFQALPLLVMPLIKSQTGEKISSSGIREGIFDREGNFLLDKKMMSKTLIIPDTLRKSLHKPFGALYMQNIPREVFNNPEKLVTVGDVTTKRVHDLHVSPKIAVIDFLIKRKRTYTKLSEVGFIGSEKVIHLQNAPGQLSPVVWKTLLEVVKNISDPDKVVILVDGEEDLLVMPLILLLPVGFTILYGQPGEGVVLVSVTEENKKQLVQLLQQYL